MKKQIISLVVSFVIFISNGFAQDFSCVINISTNPINSYNSYWRAMFPATEVADTGLALGETQVQLTRLVEELTLRLFQMEERIEELELELAK